VGAGDDSLDAAFGIDGEVAFDLGGPLASPVAAQDPASVYLPGILLSARTRAGFAGFDGFRAGGGSFQPGGGGTIVEPPATTVIVNPVYLFARRSSDGRIVGCRIEPEPGRVDPGFGEAGVVTLGFDGQQAETAGIAVGASRVFVAATRQQLGV